ncbi:MAG: hypothetical protein JWO80_2002 [Bryobacterales bacterium]|nr:hypothetical protein [Bryobacterales bacterium]
MTRLPVLLLFLPLACAENPQRMEIVLEKKVGAKMAVMDPGHVFEQSDLVRFRFKPNFDGYLYVMNRGTGGSFTLLFPRADIGTENRIQSGKEYLLPATEGGWFGIAGPAGHDVVYWLVSPAKLNDGAAPDMPVLPPPGDAAEPMTPRCNDAIFRARGDCVDPSAGPKAVGKGEALPETLGGVPAASRDLYFMQREKATVVGSPIPLAGPVVYEFRVAHK